MKRKIWLNQVQRRDHLQQVLATPINDDTCQKCIEQLDAYIMAQVAGTAYMAQFPEVTVHLDMCTDCAAAYARLYELALADAANRLPNPLSLPQPNLAFLGKSATRQLHDQLREAVWQKGALLALQFSELLLALLRPLPDTSLARTNEDKSRYSELLFNLEPTAIGELNLPIHFAVYRDAQQPETCLVELIYEPPGQSWPDLAGNQIVITVDGTQKSALTDPWGATSFADIPIAALAELRIEITQVNR